MKATPKILITLLLFLSSVFVHAMDQTPRVGNVSVLLIVADVDGNPVESSQALRDQWKSQCRSYYQYTSYGRLNLNFTETPTLTTNLRNGDIFETLRGASTNAGFNPRNFTIIVYNYSPRAASLGGAGAIGSANFIAYPGSLESSGLIHEMGHALQVGHPRVIEAGAVSYPNRARNSVAGGDAGHNMMGAGGGVGAGSGNWGDSINLPPWNLPQKYKAGFLRDNELHDARETGVYRIYNNDLAGGLVSGRRYGARIKLGESNGFDPGSQTPNLFISYQPQNTYRSENARTGVMLEALSREISFQIDATPGSVAPMPTPNGPGTDLSDFGDQIDAYLTVGNSITFPFGYKVSTIATGGTGDSAWADVRVEKNATANNLASSLAMRHIVNSFPRSTNTASAIPVAEFAILGNSGNASNLRLSGANANLFQLNGLELRTRAGISLPSSSSLAVDVSFDDPSFSGVEGSINVNIPISNTVYLAPSNAAAGVSGLERLTYNATSQTVPDPLPAVTGTQNVTDIIAPARSVPGIHAYQWSGFITIPHDGIYRFYSINSFGAKLLINNSVFIDTEGDQGSSLEAGDVPSGYAALRAGRHAISYIWFANDRSNLSLALQWEGPGIPRAKIPASAYLPGPTGGGTPPTGGGGTPPPPATATTGVNFQRWNGIGGSTIPDLTNAPAYPNSPDESRVITTTETPSNAGSDFGVRIFTWLTAPSTGDYTFWIASDDNGELRLSTDANQANARLIANVPNSTAPQEWGKFPEQRSGTISLVAGQQYYLEALMKEGGGGDNLALAWSGPGFGQRLLEGSVLRTAPSSNPTPPPTATTGVNFQRWNGIGGSTIPDLTNAPAYPNSPDESRVITTTETPSNAGSDFGVRIFTWLTAPSTGDYTFWIASDDNGELRLSTDANQANARLIANVPNSTAPQEWGKFPEQRSGTISLVAGQQYYLEALMKEGGGGDNLALAWSGPGFGQRLLEGSVLRTAPSSNPTPPPTATTGVNFQRWNGIGGSTIPDLTNAPAYPNSPDESRVITTTETPSNAGSDFGVRIFTWLTAPSTGDYTFWIASDDNGELRLSTDANQANVRLIANVPNSTAPQEWGKFPEQRSGTISLVAGQQYYLEALMKEGGGGDNLALAWSGPGFGQRLLEGSVLRTAPSSNPTPPPTATAGVNFQRWNGIGGSTIPDLTNAPAYPNSPDESQVITTTEIPSNTGNDFGVRIFTWLTAPSTGDYTFWIASDDNGELRLSTDANQANVRLIANVPNWTSPQEWDKFPEQRSGTISLVAGQQYYLEALMKESGGGDNLALAWSGPGFGQRLLEGSALRTAPSGGSTSGGTTSGGTTSGGTTSGGTTSGGSAGSPNFAQTRVNSVSNQSWTSVDLGQNYSSAVIVASPLYANNSTPPVVARVRNVSGSGFQVKLDRADGQTGAVNLDVSIIAVEEGVYTQAADGVKMEAVKYTSSVTAGKGSWTSDSRSYQNSYTNPVVVGQVMSANDADWSVFWSRGVNRASAPNSGNLNVGKQVASDPDRTRANETIGYIVIESGSGNIAGRGYSAGLGSDTVQGVVNSSTGYSYNVSGLSSASAAAVSISGIDGGDGGWAVLFGSDAISASTLKVAVDEDQLGDSERRHTTEQVSYLIFE